MSNVSRSSSANSPTALLLTLTAVDNLETIAATVVAAMHKPPRPTVPVYRVLDPDAGAEMLDWAPKTQIQHIGHGYARIGAIGDGNCLVHSLFTALSPTYRSYGLKVRQAIADRFRNVLSLRIEELRDLADMFYPDIGGAAALYDSFDNLSAGEDRTEIDLELGPVIARLYGHNFLAVRLSEALEMIPICQTRIGHYSALPTVFIHYMGGATNIGGVGNFGGQGHYEVIVRPTEVAPARRHTRSATRSAPLTLDEARTQFTMMDDHMRDVLRLFERECSLSERSNTVRSINSSENPTVIRSSDYLSPKTLEAIRAMEVMSVKRSPVINLVSSSSGEVSSETLAAIRAMEAKTVKHNSRKHRSTRKRSRS